MNVFSFPVLRQNTQTKVTIFHSLQTDLRNFEPKKKNRNRPILSKTVNLIVSREDFSYLKKTRCLRI